MGLEVRVFEGKGRGVVTTERINRGSVIEKAHCIEVSSDDYQKHVRHTVFESYLFCGNNGAMLLGLGLASLFNHSSTPNLDYNVDKLAKVITFTAARDIQAGEELLFYYGSNLWFSDASQANKTPDQEGTMHNHMDDESFLLGSFAM